MRTLACDCGVANCPGDVIGDFFSLDDGRQRAYPPYTPPFTLREYRRRAARAHPCETRTRWNAATRFDASDFLNVCDFFLAAVTAP
jgi:hypothetical protein